MPLTIRLSPYLENEARQRAELLGISLNSLISVALDLHLRSSRVTADNTPLSTPSAPAPIPAPATVPVQAMPESRPVVVHSPPPPVKALERSLSSTTPPFSPKVSVFGVVENDPKPILPLNPSQRDKKKYGQLLAQWNLRNKK